MTKDIALSVLSIEENFVEPILQVLAASIASGIHQKSHPCLFRS
jgi:hypothetical protein